VLSRDAEGGKWPLFGDFSRSRGEVVPICAEFTGNLSESGCLKSNFEKKTADLNHNGQI
jgi:hypothetical protein